MVGGTGRLTRELSGMGWMLGSGFAKFTLKNLVLVLV